MTYTEWCNQVAKLVRESGATTVITGEALNGPINYLDEPVADWSRDVTPEQAANEIIQRIKTALSRD